MIHHVTRKIPREQLEPCQRFYELLGFMRVTPPAGIAGRAVWLERGATQIHLMPADQAEPEAGHVGLLAEDYGATIKQLRAAGHAVEPRRRHWGAPRSYVRDPAGNLVELMAWRPGEDRPP
jgi:catechol 2,3-dioxygenase-like lactoylglutathione lyase family enzyme